MFLLYVAIIVVLLIILSVYIYNNNCSINPGSNKCLKQYMLLAGCPNTATIDNLSEVEKAHYGTNPDNFKLYMDRISRLPATPNEVNACYGSSKKIEDFCEKYSTGPYPKECLKKWVNETLKDPCPGLIDDIEKMNDVQLKETGKASRSEFKDKMNQQFNPPNSNYNLIQCYGSPDKVPCDKFKSDKPLGPYPKQCIKQWVGEITKNTCPGMVNEVDKMLDEHLADINKKSYKEFKDKIVDESNRPFRQMEGGPAEMCFGNIENVPCDRFMPDFGMNFHSKRCLNDILTDISCPNPNIVNSLTDEQRRQLNKFSSAEIKSHWKAVLPTALPLCKNNSNSTANTLQLVPPGLVQ
jgi:hypothetical protein